MHGLRLNLQDFGIGKKLAFQKLVKPDPVMKLCARAFIHPNKSLEEISEQGQDLMINLFGRKSNDTLSLLRNIMFTKKVATAKAFVTPEKLPQTPATRYHSLSAYYQVMV